jgi:hypothetical protein
MRSHPLRLVAPTSVSACLLLSLLTAAPPPANAAPKPAAAKAEKARADDETPDKSEKADAEPEENEPDQPKEFRFEFGLFGGYHWFTKNHGLGRNEGDPTDWAPANAAVLGGRLSLNFNRYASIELEAAGTPTHTRNRQTNMWVFGYRGQLLINFVGSGVFRPFLVLGYGALTTVLNDTSVVKEDTDGMVHGGLGFKLAFSDHVGLRFEGHPAREGDREHHRLVRSRR